MAGEAWKEVPPLLDGNRLLGLYSHLQALLILQALFITAAVGAIHNLSS